MNHKNSQERIKPFRLFRYFSYISLIMIFLGTIALSALTTHWVKSLQIQKREEFAQVLVENLNHQIFTQFVIPVALKYGEIQLRKKEQFERLDMVVRSTLYSFDVESVTIYDTTNTISYSFDPELIGKKNVGGAPYMEAVSGKLTSKIHGRGSFFELFLGFPSDIKIYTFAPLRAEKPLSRISGPVLGVVEIVQDLAADYEKVFHYQMVVPISCTMILSALFLVLTLVVRHGEKTMQRRAGEELKLKERLNRAERLSSMGEMTAGISHEIRNPLGIILSSAELLKKKMETLDPSNAFPDIIIQESTRLNNIISDFINFARPRSPNPMPCRVEDVLDRSLTFLASQAEKEGFIIRKRIRDEPPEIIADADLLYQAFLNILINAMQAMKNAGGIISIEAGANGGVVEIFFDDEGNGIPEEIVEKIWDPFFTTKEKGSGLGLGIVRNIIESHGGTIRAENRPGTGARVIVELPVNQEES